MHRPFRVRYRPVRDLYVNPFRAFEHLCEATEFAKNPLGFS